MFYIDLEDYESDDSGINVETKVESSKGLSSVCEGLTISSIVSPSPGPRRYEEILVDLPPSERKGFCVAREIFTTEWTFVNVLNMLTIDFPEFLQTVQSKYPGCAWIKEEELSEILGRLSSLKELNKKLLVSLEERIANWRASQKISDALAERGPSIRRYSDYIQNFIQICMKLDDCCRKYHHFGEAVREFEAGEKCRGLKLKDYLIKPVQRIPQYGLLLKEYLKALEKEGEDWKDTVRAIEIFREVAEHVNQAVPLHRLLARSEA